VDGVIVDAGEHVSEPGLGINAVELGRLCRTANYAERRRQAGSPSRQWPNDDSQRSA
jgi:hypothetical protein